MHTRPVRFGSQWVLVGVIFFYAVGTVIIARHMEIIDTPKSASGNEHDTISEMPDDLPDSSFGEYWQDSTNLKMNGNAFGTEHYSDYIDTVEMSQGQNTEKTSNTTNTPAKQQEILTKIRTEVKCIETVLKKSDIEPYYISGQIKGLLF